jgi:hypothetical protein
LKNLQAVHAASVIVVESELMEFGFGEVLQLLREWGPVVCGQATGEERSQEQESFHVV